MSKIRVLLADDQALLAAALSTILNAQEDIEVVTTAHTGNEAVTAAISHRIDVAILDIRMPGMDGIAAAQAILSRVPDCRIIMLTTFNEDDLVAQSRAWVSPQRRGSGSIGGGGAGRRQGRIGPSR